MSLDQALQFVPAYVLVLFRIGGLMIFAPFFGGTRIPRPVKIMFALVLAAGMCGNVPRPVQLPVSTWELALGIGGEMVFGIAMGMVLSFTFIAAQWSGEIIGQQMGLNIGEVFDPQFGASGSLVGDLYFMLTLVTFLVLGGHRDMLRGLDMSLESLPLLSLSVDRNLLDTLIGLLGSCTMLSMQLAAPMLVTMLIVDLALGCIGKAMPQMNVLTAGLSIRAILGMGVVIVGLMSTTSVLSDRVSRSIETMQLHYTAR